MAFSISHTKDRKVNHRPVASFRPRLEVLEDRVVPALTYHGGPIIPNVQAQAVFLGSNWNSSEALPFNNFVASIAGSSTSPSAYLNMLGAAGFSGSNGTVGSGSSIQGVIDPLALSTTNLQGYNNGNPLSSTAYKQTVLFDSQIRTDLTAEIAGGAVQTPNSNTLYIVFVEPNVVVDLGNGENSINTFGAYHGSFTLTNGSAVRYAVVPYAGSSGFLNDAGGYANSQAPWLSSFDSMTMVASHEIAESVTDPNANAWYDRSGNEAGDIVNGSTVYLNGYAVQRISAIPGSGADFLALTPAGATASSQPIFGVAGGFLTVNGTPVTNLPTTATGHADTSGVRSISAAGIDDFGQPMVDVIFNDGYAYEYHDFALINGSPDPVVAANSSLLPWSLLGANIAQAVPGQGVSYVRFTNGNLGEYVDPNYTTLYYGYGVNPGSHNGGVIASGLSSIVAAGVDQQGVNAVEYTTIAGGKTTLHEWRDVTGLSSTSTAGFTAQVAGHSSVLGAFGMPTEQSPSSTVGTAAVVAPLPTVSNPAAVVVVTPLPTVFSPAAVVVATPLPTVSNPAAVLSHTDATLTVVVLPAAPTFNRVDGGGGDSETPAGQNADGSATLNPSDSPTPPVNLDDVPLFGPLLKEAARGVKETRSMIPSWFWPAAPANHAPPAGGPTAPQSQAPDPDKAKVLGVNALAAIFGFSFLGLARRDRRRRRRLGL